MKRGGVQNGGEGSGDVWFRDREEAEKKRQQRV